MKGTVHKGYFTWGMYMGIVHEGDYFTWGMYMGIVHEGDCT